MARYQFTPEDRQHGGQTTAERYDMRERGARGFEAFSQKYFFGNRKLAGHAFSRIGLWKQDPYPDNGAWALPSCIPDALKRRIGAPLPDYGDIPF